MTLRKVRTAVLISGRGTNMGALIEAARDAGFPAAICLVVSNEPNAAGLETAKAAGVEALTIHHRAHASRDLFERAVDELLFEYRIEIVCLAGFMRLLGRDIVERWRGRMISIHPALLPAFRGLNTHARALEAGVKIHGCTVHHVVPELDAGPIIAQAAVPVLVGDTPATLGERVLAQEHVIYPRALKIVASGLGRAAESPRGTRPGGDARARLVVPDEP